MQMIRQIAKVPAQVSKWQPLKVADGLESDCLKLFLSDFAHAPNFRDRQGGQDLHLVRLRDDRQTIWLVQIGTQFRQKLVGSNADRSGEVGPSVDLGFDPPRNRHSVTEEPE